VRLDDLLDEGTVANKKGRYIYVKDANGSLVRVKTSSGATVTRNAKASVSSVYPGDTVMVQGAKSKDGTVTRDARQRDCSRHAAGRPRPWLTPTAVAICFNARA
jgi:hypothetical protein